MKKQDADRLIEGYVRKLYGFAVSKLGNIDEAEELAGEIADALSLSPNTVKWHLACSRKELSEGMEKTRVTGNLGVQPIRLVNMGHSGHPGSKGDTADFLVKSLSQNIAYAAYHTPKTVNEIAEELGVNPIFVKDEVDVLEEYGFLDLLPGGKYRTNIYITERSEETACAKQALGEDYAARFAEQYFAPALSRVTEIPSWLDVPDGDLNLVKWCLVPFLAHRLGTAQITDEKFSVKRKDGGDYVAYADVAVDLKLPFDDSIYAYCGDMWRDSGFEDAFTWDKQVKVWHAWQFNSHWSARPLSWRDNQYTDYGKLYAYLTGELSYNEAHISSYQRLLDKGYLLKDGDGFKVNVILCHGKQNWNDFYASLLPKTDELTALCREYAEQIAQVQLKGQPAHMHALVRYYAQNQACALHTRIMKRLLDMGVLKPPTPEQAKGLCTVLFLV